MLKNNMKKIIFLSLGFFLPLMNVLAHNGVDDGDGPISAPPTSTERMHVAAGLAILILVAALVIW